MSPAGNPSTRGASKPGFLAEPKRRHVWRAAAAYAVASWLIVQVATQVFPFFNIPNQDVRLGAAQQTWVPGSGEKVRHRLGAPASAAPAPSSS